jgi:hypothetical protein
MIRAETLLRIMSCCLNVLLLRCRRRNVMLIDRCALFGSRLVLNASRSTRVRHVVVIDDGCIVHDRLIDVRVVESAAHMHDRSVIEEVAAAPFTTGETYTHVTKAVIHAAIIADVRSPVAAMEEIMSTFPAPVRRRP